MLFALPHKFNLPFLEVLFAAKAWAEKQGGDEQAEVSQLKESAKESV